MKKNLRLLVIIIINFSLLVTLNSCTQDLYDKGEGEFSQLRADLVNVHVRHDSRVDYVLTDDGDSLRTEPPFTVSWIEKSDTIYRALLYYFLNDGVVEAYSMGPVLVPSVKAANLIKGGIKTDPVHLTSLWRARNGKYLNLRLRVMTGTTDDEKVGSRRLAASQTLSSAILTDAAHSTCASIMTRADSLSTTQKKSTSASH